jgi:hypothetical protein
MKAMFRSSIAHDADPTKPSQLPARTRLEGVVSFDTINGPDQYDSHRAFLLHQLDLDLAGAVAADAANGGAAGDAAARQEAWIDANGFRFRSVYSAGYAAWYDDPKDAKGAKAGLKQAFEDWIASHTLPAPVESALRRNYTFTPAGVEHMEMIGGVAGKGGRQHENLRDALRGMP